MALNDIWQEWDWLGKEQLVTSIALSLNPLSQHQSAHIKQIFYWVCTSLMLHRVHLHQLCMKKTIHYRPFVSFFSQSTLYRIKRDTEVLAFGLNVGLRRTFYGPLLCKEASFKGSACLQVGVIAEKCFCSAKVNSQVSLRRTCYGNPHWTKAPAYMPYHILTQAQTLLWLYM